MAVVEQRLAERLALLEEGLRGIEGSETVTPAAAQRRAGILTVRFTGVDPQHLHGALMRSGVICAARAGGIRFAPHFYTTENVIEQAVERVRQAIQTIK